MAAPSRFVSTSDSSPRYALPLLLVAAAAVGLLSANFALLPLLLVALSIVVIASRHTERLCAIMFLTLPYMAVNVPVGSVTLKLADVMAYLFGAAALARAVLRRETISLPPATVPVLVYLGVMSISAAFSPPVPVPYLGDTTSSLRNSPNMRTATAIVWLGICWIVVIGLYNTVGKRPDLYKKCVKAHILGGGIASVISLGMLALSFGGIRLANVLGDKVRDLVRPHGDSLFRLAGVAYEPMFLGFYLQTVIPVTLIVMMTRPDWLSRRVLRVCLASQVICMILTFSSGGWAGLTTSLLIMSVLLFRPMVKTGRISKIALTRLAATCAVIAVIGVSATLINEHVSELLTRTFGKITTAGGGDKIRQEEWHVGYEEMNAHPILGVGPGMGPFYFPKYHAQMQSQAVSGLREVNNLYINVLAETGLIGFAALMWCGIAGIGALAKAIKRAGPTNAPVLTTLTACLFGCAVQYLSLNPLFLAYFTGLVGLAVAGMRVSALKSEASL